MTWQIRFTPRAGKRVRKLAAPVRRRIFAYLHSLQNLDDVRARGKSLKGNKAGLWRWRVGDYRIVGSINDNVLTVLIVDVGHRRKIYD